MRPFVVGALTTETVTVPIHNLPPRLEGSRIVQLSDFHYDGQRLSPSLLEAAIAQTNALQPDLIALTGDFITHSPAPMPRLADYLSQLNSRHGIVAVLGNHDNKRPGNRDVVLRELRRVGIQALWNQVVYPLGNDFPVVGLAEFWSREFAPAAVLNHVPPTCLAWCWYITPIAPPTWLRGGSICNCRATPTVGKSFCPVWATLPPGLIASKECSANCSPFLPCGAKAAKSFSTGNGLRVYTGWAKAGSM